MVRADGAKPTPPPHCFLDDFPKLYVFSLTDIDDIVPIHFIQMPLKPFLWTNPP